MFCFSELFVVSSYFLGWCFFSCTRSHFGSCSCCPSASNHTTFQHISSLTTNSLGNFNFYVVEVVGRSTEAQWSLYTWHSGQIAYVLLISIFSSRKAKWSSCYCILVCLRCHCPMLIISQNVEIWIEQTPFGVPTLCTLFIAVLTVFITRVTRKYWYIRFECLKKFQARFEVLHRLHLNQ